MTDLKWGEWTFERESMDLINERIGYRVPLNEIDSSAEFLDWIFQIFEKGWARDGRCMVDFLEALNAVLHPQANYCSRGVEGNPNPEAVIDAYLLREKS